MRQKRAKTYRKLMSLYSLTFGFRQPYQILVDSEFCKSLRTMNLDVQKQLATVLQGLVKPMITQCCIHELYLQGKEHQAAVDIAKTFERRKCNHREAIPGDECLSSVVGPTNKHRYVIASQSGPLRSMLRTIPAVPIIHINRSVMILEPPSDATITAKEKAEEQGQRPDQREVAKIEEQNALHAPEEPARKKRKGPKGPNPLSVRKKQPRSAGDHHADHTTGRRKTDPAQEDDNHAFAEPDANAADSTGIPHASDPFSSRGAAEATSTSTRGHKRKRTRKVAANTHVAAEDGHANEDSE